MKVNGVELVVRDNGGAGIPVLLIHGSFSKDFLLAVADELTSTGRFRVISYERRGYGRKKTGPISMKGQAADASAVLSELGINKAHVFGHSTGGSIALQFAHQSPDQVASLSLGEPDLPISHLPSAPEHEAGLRELAESYSNESKKEVLAGVCAWLHGPDFMDVLRPGMFDLAADDMQIFVTAELPAYLEWKFEPEAVKSMKMPVQVIYAENTVKMSKETVDVIGHWNSRIAMIQIPGATHFFPITHPKDTAKAIVDFAVAAELSSGATDEPGSKIVQDGEPPPRSGRSLSSV
jgi:pimeloyl-ACP methyl ester carboxylesterase